MFFAPCSEFPNDNPLLHRGAIFRVEEVCGRPVAEAVAVEVADEVAVALADEVADAVAVAVADEHEQESGGADARPSGIYLSASMDDGDDIVIAPLEPLDDVEVFAAHVEAHVEIPPPSSVPDVPIEAIVEPPSVVAACPYLQLVDIVCIIAARDSVEVAAALRDLMVNGSASAIPPSIGASGLVDGTGNLHGSFAGAASAWRAILRSESEDFGPCGSLSLDEWAADLVARALGAPARSASIRRELRSAGVAAFGLVEAA
jgi:hypothetical protein